MSNHGRDSPTLEDYPELSGCVSWGIIGCGDVCEVKSGPAFTKVQNGKLVAVMRRDGDRAADFAKRHNVPRWYTDARALISDPEVQAVYVATPPSTHRELAVMCAEMQKPCLVEKPMARNANEARQMVEAFRQARLPLFVAYYRRHLPKFHLVRSICMGGQLGRITGVHISYSVSPKDAGWRLDAETAGGGQFMDLASHTLDLIDWYVGPITDVQGVANRMGEGETGVEDNVRMIFRVKGGALGSGSWNFVSTHKEDCVQIEGTEGTVRFSCFNDEPVTITTSDGDSLEMAGLDTHPHVHMPLVEEVNKDLLRFREQQRLDPGSAPAPVYCMSTGDSALRTSLVMDKVLEGFYKGRDDEFWKRPHTWLRAPPDIERRNSYA